MKCKVLLIAVSLIVIGSTAASAGTVANQNVKFALHIEPHTTRSCSKAMPAITSRDDLHRVHDMYEDIDVFFVVFDFDSVTGVQFGLTWPEAWGSAATTYCADFAIGTIVNPGDGMAVTWGDCNLLGSKPSFWPVTWSWILPNSDGEIEIGDNPSTSALTTSSCAFIEAEPDSIFNAGINVDPYEGPPGGSVGIQPTSWGAIKAMFK